MVTKLDYRQPEPRGGPFLDMVAFWTTYVISVVVFSEVAAPMIETWLFGHPGDEVVALMNARCVAIMTLVLAILYVPLVRRFSRRRRLTIACAAGAIGSLWASLLWLPFQH